MRTRTPGGVGGDRSGALTAPIPIGASGTAQVQTGKRVVVDVDLAKFFDRVNHDILIEQLRKRSADAGVTAMPLYCDFHLYRSAR